MQEIQEMWVQSLGQEDPLEKGMATQSSILALEIPWGHKELDMTAGHTYTEMALLGLQRRISHSP